MKRHILVWALLFFSFGCTSQQSGQLTQQEMDQIKKDVKLVLDAIIDKFHKLDAEGAMQHYWNSPEFIAFGADGSRSDYQTDKNVAIENVKMATSMEFSTVRADFTVLAKDLVLCAWLGKGIIRLKSGDKNVFDPYAVTFVFKLIDGQWKVIHYHDSGTYKTENAGKK